MHFGFTRHLPISIFIILRSSDFLSHYYSLVMRRNTLKNIENIDSLDKILAEKKRSRLVKALCWSF